MTYVMQPGIILIPDACLGIQNGFQYCHILYCFQLNYIITLANGKNTNGSMAKQGLTPDMSRPICNSNSGSTNQIANAPVKHIKVDTVFN